MCFFVRKSMFIPIVHTRIAMNSHEIPSKIEPKPIQIPSKSHQIHQSKKYPIQFHQTSPAQKHPMGYHHVLQTSPQKSPWHLHPKRHLQTSGLHGIVQGGPSWKKKPNPALQTMTRSSRSPKRCISWPKSKPEIGPFLHLVRACILRYMNIPIRNGPD